MLILAGSHIDKMKTLEMRKLIVPLLMLAAMAVKAQPNLPIDKETGHVVYTEVVNVNGTSADELYKRINYWFHTFFTNPKDVVMLDNMQTATVKGHHAIQVMDTVNGTPHKKDGFIKYEITVEGKDGRYRYKVNEIFWAVSPKTYIEKWLDDKAPNKAVQYSYLNQIDKYMSNMVAKLKDTMSKPVPKAKSDDF